MGPRELRVEIYSVDNGAGTIASNLTGFSCQNAPGLPASCATNVPVGTSVTLTRQADPMSAFTDAQWPCDPQAETCTFTMVGTTTMGATVRGPQEVSVNIWSNKNGAGTIVSDPPGISCQNEPGSPITCTHAFRLGTVVTLTQTPDPMSVFGTWMQAGCEPGPTCTFTVTGPVFTGGEFFGPMELRVDVLGMEEGAGSVTADSGDFSCQNQPGSPASCTHLYKAGSVVTLSASADPNSVFLDWAPAGRCPYGQPTCTVTIQSDEVIEARFRGPQPLYVFITSLENGAGTITTDPPSPPCGNAPGEPQTCTALHRIGTTVTLTAQPAEDSLFEGWAGECTGTGPCTVTINGPHSLGASFRRRNTPPVASAGGPYEAFRQTPITFDGSGTTDVDGDALQYTWDFGDGGGATGPSPTHAYAAPGTFTVTLTVSDGEDTHSATTTATITNRAPVAVAGPDLAAELGQAVTLDGGGSSDPEGDALTYEWRAADGTLIAATPVTNVTFGLGSHDVALIVGDVYGAIGSDVVRGVVSDTTPPAVSLTAPAAGAVLVRGVPVTLEWSFADLGAAAGFDAEYSVDGGATYALIPGCTGLAASARSCTWTSPGPPTAAGRIRVRGRDGSNNEGAAEAAVTIVSPFVTVTSPNTSMRWNVGTVQTIRWNHNLGVGQPMRIEVSRNGGSSWTLIHAAVPNDAATTGSYAWVVTGPTTSHGRIRVTWTGDVTVNDRSDVSFQIK